MADEQRATRRRYSAELKAQVLAECETRGASVAKVAMAHGINDNVVHNWRKLARDGGVATVVKPSEFVPVELAAALPQCGDTRTIEVELRRGAVTLKITWPLSATTDFTTWTRELCKRPANPS